MRIWVVGNPGVGKRSLIRALGATTAAIATPDNPKVPCYTWSCLSQNGQSVTIIPSTEPRIVEQLANTSNDMFVLVFDLTNKDSFFSTITEWSQLARSANEQSPRRVLLVGSHADCANERVVFEAEALELAMIEFDEYVEVCSSRPPFEGVRLVRAWLAKWIDHCERSEDPETADTLSPLSITPLLPSDGSMQQSPSKPHQDMGMPRKQRIHTSIWLYDPTEEVVAPRPDDVKLRPISRALYDIREAGSDKAKAKSAKREQTVTKLVTRSRYYGPTESSRHARWQAQQKEKSATATESRIHTDIHSEHARLERKSFTQTTKLMQQRLMELKHRAVTAATALATRENQKLEKAKELSPTRRRTSHQLTRDQPPKAKAVRSPVPQTLSPPRTTKATLSPHPTTSATIRRAMQIHVEEATDDSPRSRSSLFSHELMSPGVERIASLPAPAPLTHLQSPIPPVTSPVRPSIPPRDSPIAPGALWEDASDEDEHEQSHPPSDIDDLLDYFDGVSLPI